MKLTVIIPVYNGEAHIARCLDSLLAQTYRDFEALLIDDGSKDGSVSAIQAYIDAHPGAPLRLISKPNGGAAQTRNMGIELAETPYLAFIDQDDYVAPDYLAAYVSAIERDGADVVCGGYRRYDVARGKAIRTVSLDDDPWAKFVVTAPWAHLYRTDFLKAHGIRFLTTAIGEDVYFTLMAYAYADRVAVIPDTGYYWVDNPVSVSNSRQKQVSRAVDPFVLLDALDADLPKDGKIEPVCLEYFFYRYIVWYLLFTVRRSSPEQVEAQYGRLMAWLRARYPNFARNPMISLFRPKGEPFGIRLSVFGFNTLYRLRLILPCLKLFAARGRRSGAAQ